ncbi:MAG TPA: heavy-metal-associated domain-containing protein [Casimicrobiaceae bacterium]|nr:heavy-metal-associated domain-containing protein [Casimicrobiaceae bacterium]
METVNLDVQGMTCGGCVASVKRVLASLPGVENVDVTLKPGRASVAFDPSRVTVQALRKAIASAGYDVAG